MNKYQITLKKPAYNSLKPVKCIVSLILSFAMLFTLTAGLDFSVYAAEIVSVEYKPLKPIVLIEYIDGHFERDAKGNEYYRYFYDLNNEDKLIVTYSDGTHAEYVYNADKYNFYDENGNKMYCSVMDNQDEVQWDIGMNYADVCVYDSQFNQFDFKLPVEILKRYNPGNLDVYVDTFYITENTCGGWYNDYYGKLYFYYSLEEAYKEGDTFTVKMSDGSFVVYTYKLVHENGYPIYKFVSDDGDSLSFTYFNSQNGENPWGIGVHKQSMYVQCRDVSYSVEIPIVITEGSQETCWHGGNWKTDNGLQVKTCAGCGYQIKLPFTDLKGYESYCDYLAYTSVYNSFIAGTNPPQYTLFSPQKPITRAMFVAILYRMAGNPYEESNPHEENPFTDIKPGVYYYNAACWALDNGITNQLIFKPNDNVTREQTARFLFAYAEHSGAIEYDFYKDIDLSRYPDYKNVHDWAKEPLQWANYNNMITGTQQGYINPQGNTQRIHATRILYGFGKACNIGNFS